MLYSKIVKLSFIGILLLIAGILTPQSVNAGNDDTPTAIGLSYFRAIGNAATIDLEWRTATEFETAGFFVQRSNSASGPFTDLAMNMIPASQNNLGALYDHVDASVSAGTTYYYRLVEVETDGDRVPYDDFIPSALAGATATSTPQSLATSTSGAPTAVPTSTDSPTNTPAATSVSTTNTPVPTNNAGTTQPTNTPSTSSTTAATTQATSVPATATRTPIPIGNNPTATPFLFPTSTATLTPADGQASTVPPIEPTTADIGGGGGGYGGSGESDQAEAAPGEPDQALTIEPIATSASYPAAAGTAPARGQPPAIADAGISQAGSSNDLPPIDGQNSDNQTNSDGTLGNIILWGGFGAALLFLIAGIYVSIRLFKRRPPQ